jgi:hypothetical protein
MVVDEKWLTFGLGFATLVITALPALDALRGLAASDNASSPMPNC